MTTDTLLLILTGLCAFLAAAVIWLVLEMRLLKIQTSENLRRDEQDEMIEAILTGVRSERQEVQQAVLNVERGVSQTLAGLEKELGGGTAAQTVQVLLGEGVRELSE
jgi:DNA recombination protein RmuC